MIAAGGPDPVPVPEPPLPVPDPVPVPPTASGSGAERRELSFPAWTAWGWFETWSGVFRVLYYEDI